MDNLTHTLTGLMMARAGLGKTTQRGGSLMMMLAANAPDIDAAFGLPGSATYLQHHRWYPHSLAMVPVMALLPLLLAHWIRGASVTWRTYLACVAGVLSHLALDFTNVYGIRLFLPFSSRMPHLDITEIVDPWILLIFFLAVAAPALSALVGSEMRGRRSEGPKQAWAWFALIALLGYEGLRFGAHQRAVAEIGAYAYNGDKPPRILVVPGGVNPLRWQGVVDTGSEVRVMPVSLTEPFDPGAGDVDYPAAPSPALEAAKATPVFQSFLKFNQAPFWRVTPEGDLTEVELIDLRFGTPREPGFATAVAMVTPSLQVQSAKMGLQNLRFGR